MNKKVAVGEPHNGSGPAQCMNTQEFSHTRRYCKLPTVYVLCGELYGMPQLIKKWRSLYQPPAKQRQNAELI